MDAVVSNLEFRSNLQPIKDDNWASIHKYIMDPFALEEMQKKHLYLSERQKNQIKYSAEHCSYAEKGDYPWGTVYMEDGSEKAVCKCLNIRCSEFGICRPDFDPVELEILTENRTRNNRVVRFSLSGNEDISGLYNPGELTGADEPADMPAVQKNSVHTVLPEEDSNAPTSWPVDSEPGPVVSPAPVQEPESNWNQLPEPKSEPAPVPEPETVSAALPEPEEILPIPAVDDNAKGFEKFITVDQQAVICAPCNARAIVNAGPGTGKTYALIERIIDLIYRQETDPENIMILCFSRAAVEVIEQRLARAAEEGKIGYEYRNLMIRTFDSFATFVIAWVMENYPELLPDNYSFEGQDYDARIKTANRIMQEKSDLVELFEHLIVDEVQDLVGCRAQLVLELLHILPENCGFTLLGDACQAIYDWQASNNPGVVSSEWFYSQLFEEWPSVSYLSFGVNHRQTNSLSQITEPYRSAILTGNADDRSEALTHILRKVYESRFDIMKPVPAEINRYTDAGNLGILTRTNAQALKVSELLSNADIEHNVQKSADQQDLAPWIAKVFCAYPNETVNEALFAPYYKQVFPDATQDQIRAAWKALTSTQYGETESRYYVEKLLEGVLRRGKAHELFASAGTNSKITVSNIHRAKGREFDSVLVLNEVLVPSGNEEDDLQEHKVRYVALTRPRDRIHQLKMKPQYIYTDKTTRRCFQASFSRYRKGPQHLSHIEVGLAGDINTKSFAESEAIQSIIRKELKPGMRVKLIKDSIESGQWARYRIVLEDNENIVLGYTGRDFSLGIRRALQRIWDNNDPSTKYYPNILGDVYIGNLTTCISTSGAGLAGAKTYGNLAVWEGFTLRGLAKYEKDLY